MAVSSPILSPNRESIDPKKWTLNDFFLGYLDGKKAGIAFSKIQHQIGLIKWIGNVSNSYRLYNQAHALGLFDKYPGLIKPIKYGVVAVAVMNLFIAYRQTSIDARQAAPTLLLSKSESPKQYAINKIIWNLTSKIQAASAIALMVFEFQKNPIPATTFFVSGTIALVDCGLRLLPAKMSQLSKRISWVSRANLFWNGTWVERNVIVYNTINKFFWPKPRS